MRLSVKPIGRGNREGSQLEVQSTQGPQHCAFEISFGSLAHVELQLVVEITAGTHAQGPKYLIPPEQWSRFGIRVLRAPDTGELTEKVPCEIVLGAEKDPFWNIFSDLNEMDSIWVTLRVIAHVQNGAPANGAEASIKLLKPKQPL